MLAETGGTNPPSKRKRKNVRVASQHPAGEGALGTEQSPGSAAAEGSGLQAQGTASPGQAPKHPQGRRGSEVEGEGSGSPLCAALQSWEVCEWLSARLTPITHLTSDFRAWNCRGAGPASTPWCSRFCPVCSLDQGLCCGPSLSANGRADCECEPVPRTFSP